MSDEISVLLPYKDLQSLLVASEKLSDLEKRVARLSDQYDALYGRYSEVLERLSALQDEL